MRGEVAAIRLSRLTEVALAEVKALLNDPDIARHMPLAGDCFDEEATRKWVQGKDNQWEQNGYGPWAVHADDEFAGWCGFQKEEGAADFALVLRRRFWGLGRRIYVNAVSKGFAELGHESIVVTLPPSRKSFRVLERLGFRPDGEVENWGERFLRFRLSQDDWMRFKRNWKAAE